ASGQGDLDALDYSTDLVGMVNLLPTPSLHLFKGRARVLVPAIVVPEDVTFAIGHPRELWDGVGERAELLLVLTQRLLHFAVLGDISVGTEPAHHFSIGVFDRQSAGKKPSVVSAFTSKWKGIFPRFAGGE